MGFSILHINEESVTSPAYLTTHLLQKTQSYDHTQTHH